MTSTHYDYDYIVIGSGFGGSVSALRLSEKGHRVLVLEQGKWFGPGDFPKTNWELKKWLWLPALKCFGLFRLTFLKGITIYSGAGVGGGSLVYANTLPVPKKPFFESPSWAHLAPWESELKPFYKLASFMLGATQNPRYYAGDLALQEVAKEMGKEQDFGKTEVAVFFGEPQKVVPDPYFGGEGPEREGCHFCGACMLGCPHNAKNTLDKNYLFLAQKRGARIQAESQVYDVKPLDGTDGSTGYEVFWKKITDRGERGSFKTKGVVFSGGVLGTVPLLLKLRQGSMPRLSEKVGETVRTNFESLLSVTSVDKESDMTKGIAIGSILKIDEDTHYEIARYPRGAGFFRMLSGPAVRGGGFLSRLGQLASHFAKDPVRTAKALTVPDWSRYNQFLLFMQTLDSTLRFKLGPMGMLTSTVSKGKMPSPFIPMASDMADRVSEKLDGVPMQFLQESLLSIPSTAHILGGACMGRDASEGVIDANNKIFGYENAYVCDGSAITANIGVNPSLTITALSERAMSKVAHAERVARPEHIGYGVAGIPRAAGRSLSVTQ